MQLMVELKLPTQDPSSRDRLQGLYMYGGVGCGKTMLMDLFVGTAPAEFKVRAGWGSKVSP